MPLLDARLADWLVKYNRYAQRERIAGLTLQPLDVREGLAKLTAGLVTDIPDFPHITDTRVTGADTSVPVRIYDPAPDRCKPVCIYVHGGGHVAGSIDVYDPICRKLALTSGNLVVSVEYRLAPEYPYPAGLNDCLLVVDHIRKVLDQHHFNYADAQLAIAGDSGGGALAASVSALLQHRNKQPLTHQILIYPGLDYTLGFPSIQTLAEGYLLERDQIEWYYDQYFQQNENRLLASPLFMQVTDKLPSTLIITAGFCPLHDEARAFLAKLNNAGVPCVHQHYPGMLHAYLNMEDLVPDCCLDTYQVISRFLGSGSATEKYF
ncbi:MAG: alpha/beta hydrolase [Marinospirillum sp.]|uniref:alpha/beta hydrolase n=1 Tax=Marinospirillum sp. TaxID=2183934 RepID=UPI001A07D458|nr:alpha/beta hydrolase [Marinospirillum sp.]MBE0506647.1 alpha/beta hydrolase [Marinospirillum sp.]